MSRLADGMVAVDGCAPEVAEVIAACAFISELSGGYFTDSPWGRFDPSGYVKGWAVERAAAILTAAGSASHLVNGGGDVQCVGGRPADAAGQRPRCREAAGGRRDWPGLPGPPGPPGLAGPPRAGGTSQGLTRPPGLAGPPGPARPLGYGEPTCAMADRHRRPIHAPAASPWWWRPRTAAWPRRAPPSAARTS